MKQQIVVEVRRHRGGYWTASLKELDGSVAHGRSLSQLRTEIQRAVGRSSQNRTHLRRESLNTSCPGIDILFAPVKFWTVRPRAQIPGPRYLSTQNQPIRWFSGGRLGTGRCGPSIELTAHAQPRYRHKQSPSTVRHPGSKIRGAAGAPVRAAG
jgi:hypothetical protein